MKTTEKQTPKKEPPPPTIRAIRFKRPAGLKKFSYAFPDSHIYPPAKP